MDEDRKVRFLVAPLLFFASLAWRFLIDPLSREHVACILPGFTPNFPSILVGIVGGGFVIFTLGFVIGTLTYVVLRLGFLLKARLRGGSRYHEIAFSDGVLEQVWRRIGAPGRRDRAQELFAGVTFDHGLLRAQHEGVHRWLIRRWSAFSVAATSITGLLLSVVIAYFLGCRLSMHGPSMEWWLPVAIICLVFAVSAVTAWRDTMGMLRFQAMQEQPPSPQDRASEIWRTMHSSDRLTRKEKDDLVEEYRRLVYSRSDGQGG